MNLKKSSFIIKPTNNYYKVIFNSDSIIVRTIIVSKSFIN